MTGDKVDGVTGFAAVMLIEIRAAGNAGCQGRYLATLAAHEGAHVVPKPAVPLGPAMMG